jgi:hypothetical protein
VLIVMLFPWPGLGRSYVAAFDRVANAMRAPLASAPDVSVSLELFPEADAHHEWFAMIAVTDRASGALQHRGGADLRRAGYLQMAILLAAAAAFPFRPGVRFAAVLVGMLAMLSMLGWLPVFNFLAKKGVLHLGVVSYAALAIVERTLVGAPGMTYAVPGLSWLLVYRWLGVSSRRGAASPAQPSSDVGSRASA